MSRGDFTVNGANAVLYKVLHPDGSTNWGKWIMLAENGEGTLVVNAVFVSGDTDAASDLEKMMKSVYMAPESIIPAAVSPDKVPVSPDSAPTRPVSPDVVSGDSGTPPSLTIIKSGDVSPPPASNDVPVSFDRKEALSIIARDIVSSADVASKDSGENAKPDDNIASGDSAPKDAASDDKPQARSSVRIFTEDGVVSAGTDERELSVTSGDVTGGVPDK
jgi:hypothetical protein